MFILLTKNGPYWTDDPVQLSFTSLMAHNRSHVYGRYNQLIAEQSIHPTPWIIFIEDNADQRFLTRWKLQQKFPEAALGWFSEPSQLTVYM